MKAVQLSEETLQLLNQYKAELLIQNMKTKHISDDKTIKEALKKAIKTRIG